MNRLKDLREDNDLRQVDIAQKLGISQRNYSYFETEQTALTAEILNKLADFYKTSVDYLIYRTDNREPYPKSLISPNDKDLF